MTAKEFFEERYMIGCANSQNDIETMLIEFAEFHVKEALKAASKSKRIDLYIRRDIKGSKYKLVEPGESYDIIGTRQMWKINKASILNAYPLENIK